MAVLTVKVPEHLERRLRQHAEASGRTKSDVARKALEAYLDETSEILRGPSAFDLMRDHIGSVEGPSDLSSNQAQMAGYGK